MIITWNKFLSWLMGVQTIASIRSIHLAAQKAAQQQR